MRTVPGLASQSSNLFDLARHGLVTWVLGVVLVLAFCAGCDAGTEGPSSAAAKSNAIVGTVHAPLIGGDYPTTILNDGAVGYWRLGEQYPNTGNRANDAAPAGNFGTYKGTFDDSPLPYLNYPGAVPVNRDTAAYFTLTNSPNPAHAPPGQAMFVQIPHNANQAPSALSLECWFAVVPGKAYPTYSALFFKSSGDHQDGYGIFHYMYQVFFWVNNKNLRVGFPLPTDAGYHHVVGTYGGPGTPLRIYLDGVLRATDYPGGVGPIATPAVPLIIGRGRATLAGWVGPIDEPAIYNTALSDAQVLRHYQVGTTSTSAPSIEKFLMYAERDISLGTANKTTGGEIGVATPTASSFGPQLIVGANDRLDPLHKLLAPTISLGPQAVVGDVQALTVTDSTGSVGGTFASYPATMPRLPLALPATAGTTDVTVAPGQTQTLSPGNYGVLNDDGIVNLNPGVYSFARIAVGNNAQLVAQPGGTTDIRVAGRLSTGSFAQISPPGQPANALMISVSGNDGLSGAAVSLGANTQLTGVLNAPRGTLFFGNEVTATGAFAAFSILTADNVTFTFQPGLTPASQQPTGQQHLSGYITPEMAYSPLVGPVPESTRVTLAISLPVKAPSDFPSLADFARQVSDPANARYRQFLTPAQYAGHYQPGAADYATLAALTEASGLTVLNAYPDRELLDVTGTAGQVQKLLFANLNYYQRPDGTQFFAPDREPSLATSLPILRIAGTNNFERPTPASATGSGTSGLLLGNDFRTAYLSGCAAGLDGAGQSIAILEEEGFNPGDIQAYSAAAGLPGASISTVTFSVDSILTLFYDPELTANGSLESPGDIEMVHAMAPRAGLVVYQVPKATVFGINLAADMVHSAAHPPAGIPLSQVVTSSWALADDEDKRQSINAMAAQGQTFVQSSGDDGAVTYSKRFSWTFDNVTVVGGTDLLAFGSGTRPNEAAWSGSGGGFFGPITRTYGSRDRQSSSITTPGIGIPSYQLGFANAANLASSIYRNFPDVAMPAKNVEIFFTNSAGVPNQRMGIGGTSMSSPLFAGFIALANQKARTQGVGPVGFANPVLYAIGQPGGALAGRCFNDVRFGSNPPRANADGGAGDEPLPASGFPAVPGYDLATGLGSPTCDLLNQLASPLPTVPLPPPPPPSAVAPPFAAIGDNDSCGILSGAAECWGQNDHGEDGTGQNGNVDTSPHLSPVCTQVASMGAVSSIAAGDNHSCGVVQGTGAVWCWGDNTFGQLGTGAVDANNQPVARGTAFAIQGLPQNHTTTMISAGGAVTCALLDDGSVWCWGINNQGQLGNGTTNSGPNPLPTRVQGLPPAKQISVSPLGLFTCALLQSGGVDCWGSNVNGTLGNNQIAPSSTPQAVVILGGELANATAISAGETHACALVAQPPGTPGTGLWCWGDNADAELGQGRVDTGQIPMMQRRAVLATQVSNCTGPECPAAKEPVKAVTCGGKFTCVILENGIVECWGENSVGQLGLGTTSPFSEFVPQPLPSLNGATAIAAGRDRSCAQLPTGGLSCWGRSPVGNGTTNNLAVPTPIFFARCL